MTQELKSGDTILEGYVYFEKTAYPGDNIEDQPWVATYPMAWPVYSTEKKALSANTHRYRIERPLPHDPETIEVYEKDYKTGDEIYCHALQRKALKVKMVIE
jgi:hypothetical protein